MSWTFVNADLVQELHLYQPKQSVIEMAHLLAFMEHRRRSNKMRFSLTGYCDRFRQSETTVRRQLKFLEGIGAVTGDPMNRQTVDPSEWGDPSTDPSTMAGSAMDPSTDPSTSPVTDPSTVTGTPISIKEKHIQREKAPSTEDAAVAAWNDNKPETWAKLTKLTPLRVRQIKALYEGRGGMTQFISDIPVAFAGLPLIGRVSAEHQSFWLNPANRESHNWGALFGKSATTPKDHWIKAVEAGADAVALHSLKSPPPDAHPTFQPHTKEADYKAPEALRLWPGVDESPEWLAMDWKARWAAMQEAWALYTDHPLPDDCRLVYGFIKYGHPDFA